MNRQIPLRLITLSDYRIMCYLDMSDQIPGYNSHRKRQQKSKMKNQTLHRVQWIK